jgi:tripartite-type tricarboxylate transporter receptor subunit TctC
MTPHVIAGLTHDVLRDFVPVVNLVYQTKVVLVSASLGVTTMQDFITLAKSRPGQLNYASAGTGSSSHLDTEYLAHVTGLRLVQIPYRGSRQTTVAVATNEVQLLLASVTSAQAALAAGGARALAVLSARRSPLMPDVPTLVEAGLPRLDVKTWIGLFAPYGTPEPILDMLNQVANDILRKSEARAWFDKQGLEPVGGLRAAFDGEVRADYQRWGQLVRELGLAPR